MSGNIKPNNNNMWQIDPNQGLDDPTTVENNESTGGGTANTGTPADKIVLPPVKWVVVQPWNAQTGTFGGGYSINGDNWVITSDLNVPISDYAHEFSGELNSPDSIVEGLNGGPTAFAAGPQIGDRVLFNDSYSDQYQYIFTITALGETDVSPWELTPTTDIIIDPVSDFVAYAVAVEETPIYAVSAANSMTDALSQAYGWRLQLDNSAAFGHSSFATGHNSFAVGNYAEASGQFSVAIGNDTISRSLSSFAIGSGAQALGYYSMAFGPYSQVTHQSGVAIGRDSVTWAHNMVKIGSKNWGAVIHKIVHSTLTSNISWDTGLLGQIIPCDSESGFSLTIGANYDYGIGTETKIVQIGAGAITVSASGSNTIHGKTVTTGVGDVLTLICLATNLWVGY